MAPRKILAFSFVLIALIAVPFGSARAAFGISPPWVNADHLVKGSKYSQTIYLVQDVVPEDIKVNAQISIDESIRPWITLDNGTEFIIPKGTKQFPVVVSVNAPQNASLGSYHGTISFTQSPASAGQVTIAIGAQAALNVVVGTGIFEKMSIPLIKFLDIEEGWNPRVYVRFSNEGNIPERFDSATYELFDQYGVVRLAYAQKTDGFNEVKPFTTDEFTVEFPIDFHLGIGQYWGNVSFYKDGKVIGSQRTVFNVLEKGSLGVPFTSALEFVKKQWPFITLGLLLIIGLSFVSLRKRRGA